MYYLIGSPSRQRVWIRTQNELVVEASTVGYRFAVEKRWKIFALLNWLEDHHIPFEVKDVLHEEDLKPIPAEVKRRKMRELNKLEEFKLLLDDTSSTPRR